MVWLTALSTGAGPAVDAIKRQRSGQVCFDWLRLAAALRPLPRQLNVALQWIKSQRFASVGAWLHEIAGDRQ